jgi:S-adenosylmethionine hydrolase
MPIVTLTTDFGLTDRYVAQMKGALLTVAPGVTLVDVSHEVPAQDIACGARLVQRVAPWYPAGTVHLVVVDPGVGTDRDLVAIEAHGQRFVGPDNGLLGWLDDASIVVIDPERLPVRGASTTFHGRDLLAPAAAMLALGAPLRSLGAAKHSLCRLPTGDSATVERTPRGVRIAGRIVAIDHYGNAVTNVLDSMLDGADRPRVRVTCGERVVLGVAPTYASAPGSGLVALVGSDGELELAIGGGSAASLAGLRVGDEVIVEFGTPD